MMRVYAIVDEALRVGDTLLRGPQIRTLVRTDRKI